jgi:hypothetical protein
MNINHLKVLLQSVPDKAAPGVHKLSQLDVGSLKAEEWGARVIVAMRH